MECAVLFAVVVYSTNLSTDCYPATISRPDQPPDQPTASQQPIDVKTSFSPSQNGFHFKNNFVNGVLLGIKIPELA